MSLSNDFEKMKEAFIEDTNISIGMPDRKLVVAIEPYDTEQDIHSVAKYLKKIIGLDVSK